MNITSKQDGVYPRTASALAQQYNFGKVFDELTGIHLTIEEQEAMMKAELSLKLGYGDNDEIVSMLNASANIITIRGNRLTIDSDHFSLDADGTINATNGKFTGEINATNGKFTGEINATNGKFTGEINATSGKIGIGDTALQITENGLSYGDYFSIYTYTNYGTDDAPAPVILRCPRAHFDYAFAGGWSFAPLYASLFPEGSPDANLYIYYGGITSSVINGNMLHWDTLYNLVESNSTSDARQKNSIEALPEQYDTLFDNLRPTRYKYNDGTSDRYHTGYIAQEVVGALETAGLSTQDYAAVMLTNEGTEDEVWKLRRDEFVALNTWQIQKLKARVAELEERIKQYG